MNVIVTDLKMKHKDVYVNHYCGGILRMLGSPFKIPFVEVEYHEGMTYNCLEIALSSLLGEIPVIPKEVRAFRMKTMKWIHIYNGYINHVV